MPFDGLDGTRRVSCKNESLAVAPIREVGIERHRPFELGKRRLMLAPLNEDMPELCTRLRQIGVELHRLASKMMGLVKGGGTQIIIVERVEIGRQMRKGQPRISARVARVDHYGLF